MLLSFVLYALIIMLVAFHAQSVLGLSLCLALSVSCGHQSYLRVSDPCYFVFYSDSPLSCVFVCVCVTLCLILIVLCLVCAVPCLVS